MKKLVLIVGVFFLVIGCALFLINKKGQAIVREGEFNTRWIRLEMWRPPYFNKINGRLTEEEKVLLRVISGAPKTKETIEFLAKHSCRTTSDACTTSLLAVAGILLGERSFDRAKQLINQAARSVEITKSCSIKLEIAILRNIVEVMKGDSISEARDRAERTIQIIKSSKGVNSNLQNLACDEMAREKPELFHAYVMQVAEIMSFANGSLAESAAYLRKINQLK